MFQEEHAFSAKFTVFTFEIMAVKYRSELIDYTRTKRKVITFT
jgi:hypothetical protein